MSETAADIEERRLALDLGRSFCVQAPAGSGKTELLTQRYLSLLAVCEKPEEILAITFTRKASMEMRNRILGYMLEAESLSSTALAALPDYERFTLQLAQQVIARNEEKGWMLKENSSRLRISTIDSFNAFLTSQLPVVSELGILPEILDDAQPLYEEAVIALLDALNRDSPLTTHLETVLSHFNNQWRTLTFLLTRMLSKRDQWLGNILDIKHNPGNARNILESTLDALIEQKLSELARALSPYLADLLPLLHFAADNLREAGNTGLDNCDIEDGLPAEKASCLGQWQVIGTVLLTNDHRLRKQVDKRIGFPAQGDADYKTDRALRKDMKAGMQQLLAGMREDAELVRLLEEFRHLPAAAYPDSQWQVLESLTVLLPELVSRLTLVFSRHGQTDHTQVSIAALNALGSADQPTDLALRLDYHLKHILVDEFQDTSSLQISLLEKLTAGWQPDEGRTLFIVGDGMQSCYGFRNANVGLFLAARDNGIGEIMLEPLQLTANFRSQANVVDWVNNWFAPAFPQQDDIARGGVRFSPARPIHEEMPGAGVSPVILAVDAGLENTASILRTREAEFVADKILSIQQECPSDSIAILVRTRNHLQEIIPVLRERGIRWHAAEIDSLDSYPAVQDLLILTRALLNPADITAWFGMLRAPFVGLPLDDIHTLARASQNSGMSLWQIMQSADPFPRLSGEARNILERIVPVLVGALRNRCRFSLWEWVEKTWLSLGGPATLSDIAYLDNMAHFFRLLAQHDEKGDITDIHRFIKAVNSEYADGLDPQAPVTIMTIHKAKGLEFDHVIIPGLERSPRSDDNPLLRWREHISDEGRPELVISMPAGRGQDRDPTYQHLKFEAALQQRLETTRLFYIGVTRAIKNAVLIGSVEAEGENLKPPDKKSLLSAIWPQLADEPTSHATLVYVDPVIQDGGFSNGNNELLTRRLPPQWQFPETFSPFGDTDIEENPQPESVHDNLLARVTGDIIHDCLHRASEGRLDLADDRSLKAMALVWRQSLEALAADPDAAVTAIHKQLAQCLEHEKFHWLVKEEHSEPACELELSDYRSGNRQSSVIDRTFVDDSGVRWIIDYKSSEPPEGSSREEFLVQQEAAYTPQLQRYAGLFRALEDRKVRTALFFTAIPEFHEVVLD